MRAAGNGHSMEAEVRDILKSSVKSEQRVKMGDALFALGRRFGLTSDDIDILEQTRSKTPAEPMSFE
jgi:plasmid stability protein